MSGGCAGSCRMPNWRGCWTIRRSKFMCFTRTASPPASSNWTRAMARRVNLSYFGLMPHMIGTGAGPGFLRQAIDAAWRHRAAHCHGQYLHRRSSAGVAELPARRIQTVARGAGDLGRAAASWDADPRSPANLSWARSGVTRGGSAGHDRPDCPEHPGVPFDPVLSRLGLTWRSLQRPRGRWGPQPTFVEIALIALSVVSWRRCAGRRAVEFRAPSHVLARKFLPRMNADERGCIVPLWRAHPIWHDGVIATGRNIDARADRLGGRS